jgi:hypothetical protein
MVHDFFGKNGICRERVRERSECEQRVKITTDKKPES